MNLLKAIQLLTEGTHTCAVRKDEEGNIYTVGYGDGITNDTDVTFYKNGELFRTQLEVADLDLNWSVVDKEGNTHKRVKTDERLPAFLSGLKRLAKGTISTITCSDDFGTHIWFVEDGKFKVRMEDSVFESDNEGVYAGVVTEVDVYESWKGKR